MHHKYDFRNAEAEVVARNNFYCSLQAKTTDTGHRYFQGKKDREQILSPRSWALASTHSQVNHT